MNKKRALKITLLSFAIIFLVSFSYLLCNVIINQNSYSPVKSDAIVVLGHSISSPDSEPSQWLIRRLEVGLELYDEGYADKIIVSGGKGNHDYIPVANAMANWLFDKGLTEDVVIIEADSKNTGENFEFTKKIADENNINSIIVVTNDFHMYRSMMTARDYFADVSGCSAYIDFNIRKFFAYLKEPLSIIKYQGLYMISYLN